MDVMSALRQISNDPDTTLRRFSGNEKLLAQFMKKFCQDSTFARLESAVQQMDYAGAVLLAHTLKGLASNLGFTELCRHSSSMAKHLRSEEYDSAMECFSAVKTAYRTVIATLKSLD